MKKPASGRFLPIHLRWDGLPDRVGGASIVVVAEGGTAVWGYVGTQNGRLPVRTIPGGQTAVTNGELVNW
ncbi:MAG: hypothetical protein IPM39_11600 [Chloroflexi bacterium]|nr:hypothetical protein [Chloroflexota bacterium]